MALLLTSFFPSLWTLLTRWIHLVMWFLIYTQTPSPNTPKNDRLCNLFWANIIFVFFYSSVNEKTKKISSCIKINWCKCETNRKLLLGTLEHSITFSKSLWILSNHFKSHSHTQTLFFLLQNKKKWNCLPKLLKEVLTLNNIGFSKEIGSGIAQNKNKKFKEYLPSFRGTLLMFWFANGKLENFRLKYM